LAYKLLYYHIAHANVIILEREEFDDGSSAAARVRGRRGSRWRDQEGGREIRDDTNNIVSKGER
jgi:hypothetical protein